MSLARAERRRLFKRRLTRYMLLLVLLILGAVAAGTFLSNEKIGPEQIAAAKQKSEQNYQQAQRDTQRVKDECERAKAEGTADSTHYPEDCSMIYGPDRESFKPQWYMPPTFGFRDNFEKPIVVFAAVLAMFAFVLGASYVGAEWHSGGMMNLLLWRSRRLSVLLTKLGTLLASLLGIYVVLGAAWTGTFWGIATARGNTDHMTLGVWQSFGLTGLRGLGLVIAAGVIGFGLASVGRHTAMALGTAVGVAIVGFVGVSITLGLVGVRFQERWIWPRYIQAWMQKKLVLQDWNSCAVSSLGGCQPEKYTMTWQQSGLLIAAVTLVVFVVALWTMRRRDIS